MPRSIPEGLVVELEGLRDAVAAKTAGWQVLQVLAAHDDRIDRNEVDLLVARADDQADRLRRLHLARTEELLAGPA